MDECKVCANADNEYCFACDNGNQFKPMTNSDRFRTMSDREIASFFYWDVDGSGKTQWQWLEWLRQECE